MKCNQSRPGFELESPYPFPTTITITPRSPPKHGIITFAAVAVREMLLLYLVILSMFSLRERKERPFVHFSIEFCSRPMFGLLWLNGISTIVGYLMPNPFLYISLLCHAASTDIPYPLSPLLPIVHRLWQVFRATSRILTSPLYACLSWSFCFIPAICGGP